MATAVNKWKVYCTTEASWRFWYLPDTEAEPTKCPNDTAHTIDPSLTSFNLYTKSTDVELTVSDPANPPAIAADFAPTVEQAHYVSHNFADKSTWYQNSVRVIGATYTVDAVDPKIYKINSQPSTTIICANMGKINQEDVDPDVLKHKFKVYVDGVEKVIAGPNCTAYPDTSNWTTYGAEVEVDWATGDLKFATDPAPGSVTSDYSKLDPTISAHEQSEYFFKAPPNKKLRVLKAETQFTKGCQLNDSVIFKAESPLTFSAIQTDATLDPTSDPVQGTRYLIKDATNLHSNFGTIKYRSDGKEVTLSNNDIVEFDSQRGWGIIFDSSEYLSAKCMDTTTGIFYDWDGSSWLSGAPGALTEVEVFGSRKTYKTLPDFLNEATGNYPIIPAGFVVGPRGSTSDILQIPWNWVGAKTITSSSGAHIEMVLENGVPFTGTDAVVTVTFYCQVFDE